MANLRYIVTDPSQVRQSIHRNVMQAIQSKFPIQAGNYRVELSNMEVKHETLDGATQKELRLSKGNAPDGVYGKLTVYDGGSVLLEIDRHKLMNLPYFTNRFTLLVDGSEYSIVNQLRTKSGVFTRKKANEELESSFNLEKGANFKLTMVPETGVFYVDILNHKIPMYAFLRVLGADSATIQQSLGQELYLKNSSGGQTAVNRAIDTLYDKLVRYKTDLGAQASKEEKTNKIREYFSGTKLDPEVTTITLGDAYTKVNYQSVLAAAQKILRVYNEEDELDERDHLEFQKVYSVEDIIREVIEKSTSDLLKIRTKLGSFQPTGEVSEDRKKIKAIFSPSYFTAPVKNFITTSSISRLPTQINPLEILDMASTVTRLGEGAIGSERAAPVDARQTNMSYMGVIDPVATPESSKIGLDTKFATSAIKGDDNELYKKVVNNRTGKIEKKRLIELFDKYVGFPETKINNTFIKGSDLVPAVYKGRDVKVRRDQLDYQVTSPHNLNTITTNNIPFLNANEGTRMLMGAKHQIQALPLLHRDNKLVESVIYDENEKQRQLSSTVIGGMVTVKSPVNGRVSKIDDSFIYILGADGKEVQLEYTKFHPLASKTVLREEVLVKVGDTVKEGQQLTENNFTKNGKLALGKNVEVAYIPYHGWNHEDGIVISESAAKKFTSEYIKTVTVEKDSLKTFDKSKYTSFFPTNFSTTQLRNIDSSGVVKKGSVLQYGDPLVLVLVDNAESRVNQVLGLVHKSLISKYKDESIIYDDDVPAEVVEVSNAGKVISVLLRSEKPIVLGDKLSGSFGNKGTISKILPDDQMIQNEEGKPVDLVLTSASVFSRINPGQILETALGKVARKTGKVYEINNFDVEDYTKFVSDELTKHNVKDKETVTDPTTGKKISGVFVGVQHMHKLFKTADAGFAARGVDGPHDQDDVPTGSGDSGPKGVGQMEVTALLTHNARDFLHETTMLRGAKNSDYWRTFQLGGNPQFPIEKKTFGKFTGLLRQAGIKLDRVGDDLVFGPLTDKDVLELSAGEISDARRLNAKDLSPEQGGLFDENVFGGLSGDRWGHVKLAEPVLNPVFEKPAKILLQQTTKEFKENYFSGGGASLRDQLNKIDVKNELAELKKLLNESKSKLSGTALDNAVKRYKYLSALDKQGIKPGDAYTLQYYPITPPTIRPISVGRTGDLLESDANNFYKNLILQNNAFKDVKSYDFGPEEEAEGRKALYERVQELSGTLAPSSPFLRNKSAKGALQYLSGNVPKEGFFQKKMVYNKTNLSGRAVIGPDVTLGLDEIGLPEEAAWSMYAPFIIRGLTQQGYSALQAKEEMENRSDLARQIMLREMEERPIVTNRAPSLWKHSFFSAMPVLREGRSLKINTMVESGTNSDHDGDAQNIYVPVSDRAVEDAKKMLPSRNIYSDKAGGKRDLLIISKGEPIVGLYRATSNLAGSGKVEGTAKKYKNLQAAWSAYYKGELRSTDLVEIG